MSASHPKLSYAWNAQELLQLVRAWGDVVSPPRDKKMLLPAERIALHARFSALAGASRRSLSSVSRQHHRLVTAYRLIVEYNARSEEDGGPDWFQLPAAQQHELRRVHGKKEGMTAISEELFEDLARICQSGGGETVATRSPSLEKPSRKAVEKRRRKVPAAMATVQESSGPLEDVEKGGATESPRLKWGQREWLLFVDAWGEAVDDFVDYGNDQREKVKLPNWLIRQRFIALGGSEETTVGSITAKKRCVIQSFHFVRECAAALEARDGSDWFQLAYNERFRLQRKLIGPKSSQRLGCEIDLQMFAKIATIIDKEEMLLTVTGGKRKRSRKRAPSVSSESSLAASSPRSPSPEPEELSDLEETPPPPPASPPPPSVHGEEDASSQVDEKVIESLLEAQNARFEQLMHDLREERMEERKQNQTMLLEILHQRAPPEDSPQSASYMETLVGKQQEQLMDLFAQMQKERQQEREDYHALLRQLSTRPRA
ncbi:hypothetical protein BBJ28_00006037 [Nothophytophthora sp. Chile5]|nr:hypothetical protein BBJ28_00006037 [Nothophytophthora sp. Chile5]